MCRLSVTAVNIALNQAAWLLSQQAAMVRADSQLQEQQMCHLLVPVLSVLLQKKLSSSKHFAKLLVCLKKQPGTSNLVCHNLQSPYHLTTFE